MRYIQYLNEDDEMCQLYDVKDGNLYNVSGSTLQEYYQYIDVNAKEALEYARENYGTDETFGSVLIVDRYIDLSSVRTSRGYGFRVLGGCTVLKPPHIENRCLFVKFEDKDADNWVDLSGYFLSLETIGLYDNNIKFPREPRFDIAILRVSAGCCAVEGRVKNIRSVDASSGITWDTLNMIIGAAESINSISCKLMMDTEGYIRFDEKVEYLDILVEVYHDMTIKLDLCGRGVSSCVYGLNLEFIKSEGDADCHVELVLLNAGPAEDKRYTNFFVNVAKDEIDGEMDENLLDEFVKGMACAASIPVSVNNVYGMCNGGHVCTVDVKFVDSRGILHNTRYDRVTYIDN